MWYQTGLKVESWQPFGCEIDMRGIQPRKSKETIHLNSHVFRQSSILSIPFLFNWGHSEALQSEIDVPLSSCGNLVMPPLNFIFIWGIDGGLINTGPGSFRLIRRIFPLPHHPLHLQQWKLPVAKQRMPFWRQNKCLTRP